MIPVSSPNIHSIGYDQSSQTLYIQFTSELHVYSEIPQHVFSELLNVISDSGL